MSIFDKIYQKVKAHPKRIVLPEGDEARVLKAAAYVVKRRLAQIVLLGNKAVISRKAKINSLDLAKVEIIEPQNDERLPDYVRQYWQLRQHRGVTVEIAQKMLLAKPVFYGAMMLRAGKVDGFVAGCAYTTSDVAKAILHCIPKADGCSTVSGAFLVEIKDKGFGEKGLFLFADCAIVPVPTQEQLADIALSSADVWKRVTGYKARLAMLSFSTKGSGKHPCSEKVRQATEIARKKRPDLIIDGELQVDSAVVPAVAKIKAPESALSGRANILIFPSLESGNIAYKLMQRLAQARVVGPIMQGLSCACSDLSRGSSWQEIVDAIVVTVARAQ